MMKTRLTPVCPSRHQHRYWRRFTSYDFVRDLSVCPIVENEIPDAAAAFPIAFQVSGTAIEPVAILSLAPNLPTPFVSDQGEWLATYVPSILRCAPFHADRLSRWDEAATTQFALLVDEASNLISDDPSDQSFFDPDGSLSSELRQVVEFFKAHTDARETSRRMCRMIDQLSLFEAMPTDHSVCASFNLMRVRSELIHNLADDDITMLTKSGALRLIHAHQVSLCHLGWLMRAQSNLAKQTPPLPRLEQEPALGFLQAMAASGMREIVDPIELPAGCSPYA